MGRPQNADDPYVRVTLRVPKPIHAALVALAAKEERSMHTTALRLFREGIERTEETAKNAKR